MPSITLTAAATGAAQFLGVLDSGESLSTQQLADALLAANNLLDSWTNEQVVAIQSIVAAFTLAAGTYTPATLLAFADATTPITVPKAYPRALTLGLAVELAPQYDMQPSPAMLKDLAEARAAACPMLVRIASGAPAAGGTAGGG